MFEFLGDPLFWAGIVALVALDLVLGVDNARDLDRLAVTRPEADRSLLRRVVFGLGLVFRLGVLLALFWLFAIERPAFSLAGWNPSWGDLVLVAGGVFLLHRATTELATAAGPAGRRLPQSSGGAESLPALAGQLALLAAVYSVDSVVLALAVVEHPVAMVIGLALALLLLHRLAAPLAHSMAARPAIRILALSMLMPLGAFMLGRGLDIPVFAALYLALALAAGFLGLLIFLRRHEEAPAEAVGIPPATEREPGLAPHAVEPSFEPFASEPGPMADRGEAVSLEPDLMVPEPSLGEPELVEPELAEPEMAESELVEPWLAEPELVEAELAESEVVEPELVEPELVEPEFAEPEVVEPELAEPEFLEPEWTEPEVVAPEQEPEPVPALGEPGENVQKAEARSRRQVGRLPRRRTGGR